LDEGLSERAAAARLKVSPATGSRWLHSARTNGHVEPARQGRPKGSGKLEPYCGFFKELVAQDPDIALNELRDALDEAEGVRVHHSSIALRPPAHRSHQTKNRRRYCKEWRFEMPWYFTVTYLVHSLRGIYPTSILIFWQIFWYYRNFDSVEPTGVAYRNFRENDPTPITCYAASNPKRDLQSVNSPCDLRHMFRRRTLHLT